jgi:hypothetical protein
MCFSRPKGYFAVRTPGRVGDFCDSGTKMSQNPLRRRAVRVVP